MAGDLLMSISQNEKERAIYRSRRMLQTDMESNLATVEERGEKKGRAKGKQEILDLLKSGKSPEDILREYGTE